MEVYLNGHTNLKTFLYENVILARYFLDISNFPLYHGKCALFVRGHWKMKIVFSFWYGTMVM
jgi:hypothetical protein